MKITCPDEEYWIAIDEICLRLGPDGGIMDVPFGLFEEMALYHGLEDAFDVIADVQTRMTIAAAEREIAAGHEYHRESDEAKPMEELVGHRLIDPSTELYEIERFIELVERGAISDSSGYGEFVSGDGLDFLPIRCHVGWIEEFRDEWPYIAWFRG